MARNRLEGIRACIFDAYGTLFDYRSAASRCRDVLGENFDQVNALWREKQLQYSWLRAIQGRHVDFWQVTGEALDFALDTAAIADSTVRDRLMAMYLKLDAFPEVPDMLKRLNVAGLKTAILSNGSPDSRLVNSSRPFARATLGHADLPRTSRMVKGRSRGRNTLRTTCSAATFSVSTSSLRSRRLLWAPTVFIRR